MPYVKTPDGIDIFYEDWGSGNRFVFTSEIYIDYYCAYTRELAKRGYHVIAVQMRGYGKSSRVPQTDDIALQMSHIIQQKLALSVNMPRVLPVLSCHTIPHIFYSALCFVSVSR